MTPSQKKRIERLTELAITQVNLCGEKYAKEPIVKIDESYSSFIAVTIEVHRNDCDEFSQRNLFARVRLHAMIGKRGKVLSRSSCFVGFTEYSLTSKGAIDYAAKVRERERIEKRRQKRERIASQIGGEA